MHKLLFLLYDVCGVGCSQKVAINHTTTKEKAHYVSNVKAYPD
jgi:hypothetical protein